jgi:hypothetical protein
MKKLQAFESISIRNDKVELRGTFGTVVLDRSRLSVEIHGPLRPGYIGKHMVIKSDGCMYGMHINELCLLDDAIIDLLDIGPSRAPEKPASHSHLADWLHHVRPSNTCIYHRRKWELMFLVSGGAVVTALVLLKHEQIGNTGWVVTLIAAAAMYVGYSWTKGPVLRRIEIHGERCTIKYWDRRNWPRVHDAAVSDVRVRTITCRINGDSYVADVLQAGGLIFFLVRDHGRLSQWTTADATALRNSGVLVVGT